MDLATFFIHYHLMSYIERDRRREWEREAYAFDLFTI